MIKESIVNFYRQLEQVAKKAGRDPRKIKVLFATKYLSGEQLISFLDIAQKLASKGQPLEGYFIGENRVQDAEAKIVYIRDKRPDLLAKFSMVMIGNLQKNKINKAIEIFQEFHAVDSLELARAINSRLNKTIPIFLEVNLSGEESKHGFSAPQVEEFFPEIKKLPNLEIKGLMTMAPYFDDPEKVRPIFRNLRKLADKYKILTSMGMSHDWKQAIEEGSDIIRVGSLIFSLPQ